ncbi:hypothetical protein Vadar_023583 [Vaccinium darrowii]|uniref:Uncharacterized protein n=1 Tax=Vaccinium darrowii TaxID=229202 RepID=A0ACB7X352_9ERIC|nr:hypothetical protein Vadar_023583 [Vaccinium darrowii]
MRTASNQKKGFMTITAHFIVDSWTLQSRILRREFCIGDLELACEGLKMPNLE